jgi:hypothetical protein
MNDIDLVAEYNFGKKNLLVSGCSFTSGIGDMTGKNTWCRYLKSLGSFDTIYDCSWSGAGNTHIKNSIMHMIETNPEIRPDNTTIIVMWSGYDRDDLLIAKDCVVRGHTAYEFNKNVATGYTGGTNGNGNMIFDVTSVKKLKNLYSRALENYLIVVGLEKYLQSLGFDFVFCEFSTGGEISDDNFDPVLYLEPVLKDRFIKTVRQVVPNIGDWSKNGGLQADRYHPNDEHQLSWTKEVLIPFLLKSD